MISYNQPVQLMDARRIERTLKRMTLEILEDAGGAENLVVAGINKRGMILAKQIKQYVRKFENYDIDILNIRCNKNKNHELWDEGQIDSDCYFVLTDDVIFSGRTIYSALQAISKYRLPESVSAAALIDRGHRRVPIHPRYTGLHIPTKFKEHISVHLGSGSNNRVELKTVLNE